MRISDVPPTSVATMGRAQAAADIFAERGARFYFKVDGDGDGVAGLVSDPPEIEIHPGPPSRMTAALAAALAAAALWLGRDVIAIDAERRSIDVEVDVAAFEELCGEHGVEVARRLIPLTR